MAESAFAIAALPDASDRGVGRGSEPQESYLITDEWRDIAASNALARQLNTY